MKCDASTQWFTMSIDVGQTYLEILQSKLYKLRVKCARAHTHTKLRMRAVSAWAGEPKHTYKRCIEGAIQSIRKSSTISNNDDSIQAK